MRRRFTTRALALVALLLSASGGAARAGEHYFVLVFGSQDHPKHYRNSHTWATFVRAVGEGTDPGAYSLEAHTISWYPATREVRVWKLRPERGVNMDLDETLRIMLSHGETVTMWGPFRIGPELWNRSLEIRRILLSGAVRYRAIDGQADLLIADCIHAVAAVDPVFGRGHYPLIRIGKPASRYIAREVRMRSRFDQGDDNEWIVWKLGLRRYPIQVVPPRAVPPESCVLCLRPE